MQTEHDKDLEQLSTQQLDQMLQETLEKEDADPAQVKEILAVLKEREKDMPVTVGDQEKLAWQRYKAREKEAAKKPARKWGMALRVAGIAVALMVLLVSISTQAEAETFWERLVRWTDSVISFFSPDYASNEPQPYEFRTDHPGLQQIYDTVAGLGVTDPVVPMWLPEGYTLILCQDMKSANKTTVVAAFQNGDKLINFNIDVYFAGVNNQYQKDETDVKIVEFKGIEHRIVRNTDAWVAIWAQDQIECSISIDCQEDELYKILRSVYDKEEAQ